MALPGRGMPSWGGSSRGLPGGGGCAGTPSRSAEVQEERCEHPQGDGEERGPGARRAQAAGDRGVPRGSVFRRRRLIARLAEGLEKRTSIGHPSQQQRGGESPETPHPVVLRAKGVGGPGELGALQCPRCPTAGRTDNLLSPGRFPFTPRLVALGLSQRREGSELSLESLPCF